MRLTLDDEMEFMLGKAERVVAREAPCFTVCGPGSRALIDVLSDATVRHRIKQIDAKLESQRRESRRLSSEHKYI